jgi:hypothetical protein
VYFIYEFCPFYNMHHEIQSYYPNGHINTVYFSKNSATRINTNTLFIYLGTGEKNEYMEITRGLCEPGGGLP